MNKARKEPCCAGAGLSRLPCAELTQSEKMSLFWPCLCPYQQLWEGESRKGAQVGVWGGQDMGGELQPPVHIRIGIWPPGEGFHCGCLSFSTQFYLSEPVNLGHSLTRKWWGVAVDLHQMQGRNLVS